MMRAHTKVEAVEAEDSRVEFLDQGTMSPVWSLVSPRTVSFFVSFASVAEDCPFDG